MSEPTAEGVRPAGNRNRVLTWLVVAGLLAAWVGLLLARRPGDSDSVAKGVSVDFGWKLEDLEGRPASLAEYEGRPIFLNLWATWCPPCVRELPSIQALASDPRVEATDAVVLAVAVGREPRETVKSFVDWGEYGSIVMRLAAEMPPAMFQTEGIPATFVIGRDGRIVRGAVGSRDWHTTEIVEELVDLAGQPGASTAKP